MEQSSANPYQKKLLIALLILIPIAYFLRLNSYQLIFEEPRRALVALEMLLANNWMVPTTNGELYYNKPPLYNWVLIGFFSLLGKAEWVVRLPSILSLFLTAFIHYRISRQYIGKNAALLSALFYLTSADILFYFSLLGEIDIFYALIVYVQCLLIFHFYQQKKWHWLFICSYLLTAAGVLTKGIPSLFFQAITLLAIFIINKDYKRLFSIWHFAGIAILALSAGGYFYLYSLQHDAGPYLARLFTETFSRTGMESSLLDNFKHFLNFPVQLIKISAPWFLLFFITIGNPWKKILKENPFLTYCLWFCLANGLIYLLSPGTRERYLYMFFPFIYSLLTYSLLEKPAIDKQKWIKGFYYFLGISVTAGLFGLAIFGMIRQEWVVTIACVILGLILAAGVYFIKFKKPGEWILAGILIVLIARIGFDLIILPTKKENDPYRADALKMSEIIGNEDVYLIGPPEPKTDNVQFAGIHFTSYSRNEPTYMAFQTSFYLSRYTGKILKYTQGREKEGFYIGPDQVRTDRDQVRTDRAISDQVRTTNSVNPDPIRVEKRVNPDSIRIYYRFNNRLNKEDQWYILFKYLEND
ncbi:4-amino-4-deoxy-L-arabinose transferase [Daejeonella rubra]|uniref:4-amino-4-deoxy-L-arabinose transferase n=1 Tax=Daejeonella rubra TaxID=990371 RepID=A0A1G9RB50_9SPHI|nr:glycosyltransferase family 39 protein [Daejeonella rubra]SDM19625.1 4-amino-4-deoxy-L-arabinose transferase [Daejeonella rubra]